MQEAEREVQAAPCQAVVLRHGDGSLESLEIVKKIRDVRPETFVLGMGGAQQGGTDAFVNAKPSPGELLAVLRVSQAVQRAREAESLLREQLREIEKATQGQADRIRELEQACSELQETVQNAEAMAFRDELTQLYNRRFFLQALKQQMERSRRDGSGFALAMMDIDHFKEYNDTHGHIAGDEMLKELAQTFLKTFRRMDTVARYGGEEFVALMPEAPPGTSTRFDPAAWMERVRAAVEEMAESGLKKPADERITISAGVVVYPKDGKHSDTLIAEVDARLYRAKLAGRNRVCASPEEPAKT
jgi:diguanylate cyclase (GGDEF)-like protein